MAFEIIANIRFKKKLASVYDYLCREWSVKTGNDFLDKVVGMIDSLSEFPAMGSPCQKRQDIRKFSVTKHNKIYHRIHGAKIFIIDMIDSRQNPKNNKYE